MKLVGFVGTGKMGGALASAVIKKVGGDKVMLADAQIEKAKAIADEYGCDFGSSNDVVKNCKFAFLGVKPQVMGAVADSIKNDVSNDTILVSMAAGIVVGIIGFALCGINYPIYKKILEKDKAKYAYEIVELARQISEEK